MDVITSKQNARVKFARQVAAGKERELILLEGLRLVRETAKSLARPTAFLTPRFLTENPETPTWFNSDAKSLMVSDEVLSSIATSNSPQGIAVVAERPSSGPGYIEDAVRMSASPLVIFLVEINNPSNLGAIFRTSEAAGVSAIITSKGSSDAFSTKSIRASMGAVIRIPIWDNVDYLEALEWGTEFNLIKTALDSKAGLSYLAIDWQKPRLLIFGSEAHGLSESQIAATSESIKIPMRNQVESLNIGVSCGIALFERLRQIEV